MAPTKADFRRLLWSYVYESGVRARGLKEESQRESETSELALETQKLVTAILEGAPSIVVDPRAIEFKMDSPDFDGGFGQSTLEATRKLCEQTNFDLVTLIGPLTALSKLDANSLKLDAFNESKRVKKSIDDRLRELTREVDRMNITSLEKTRRKFEIQAQIESLKKKLDEFDEERDRIRLMSWLPDLTIRVGTVVLLLFLSGVFLATCRYTLSVSAFYYSRSDCLRLVSGGPGDKSIDASELSDLVSNLTLEKFLVVATKLPYEALAEGVKTAQSAASGNK